VASGAKETRLGCEQRLRHDLAPYEKPMICIAGKHHRHIHVPRETLIEASVTRHSPPTSVTER